MAVLTVKKGANQFADLSTGWKEVTIVGAKRGQYDNNGTKYIDITFEGYPENVKLRAHQKFNKKTNEEFVVLNIFRNANAGVNHLQLKQVVILGILQVLMEVQKLQPRQMQTGKP